MLAHSPKTIAGLSRVLQPVNCRLRLLEIILGLDLASEELTSITTACAYGNTTLGVYYHWKITQWASAVMLKKLDTQNTMKLVANSDRTSYERIDSLATTARGILIATPHYGHFVLSIVSLAKRLSRVRPVFVFYDPPAAHASNEIFDDLHQRLFGELASNVVVIHNNRAGIARAVRELRLGAAVVIMPDVYKDVDATYQISFCDRIRNVMLGTATLARKTDALILPMLSKPLGVTRFQSVFGQVLAPLDDVGDRRDPERMIYADYLVVAKLFSQLEQLMGRNVVQWQYSRSHFATQHRLPHLPEADLEHTGDLFLADPRVHVELTSPVTIN